MTSPASLKTPYLEDNTERTLTNSSTEADIRAIAFSVIGSAIGGVVGLIDDGKYGSIGGGGVTGGALGLATSLIYEASPQITNIVMTHPFADAAVVIEALSVSSFIFSASRYGTIAIVEVAGPYLTAAAVPFVIAEVAYQNDVLKGFGIGTIVGGVVGVAFGPVGICAGVITGGVLGGAAEWVYETYHAENYPKIEDMAGVILKDDYS